jgi:hypothetical protein
MVFLQQFHYVIKHLEKQGMFINHFWVNPPASEEEIAEVENTLGYKLDTSITSFFRECNGVQLLWTHPNNKYLDKLKQFTNSKEFISYGITDDYRFDGAILIEPIKETFLSDWYDHIYFDFTIENKEEINFAGTTYIEPDFSKRIKPFDLFDSFFDVSFFLNGISKPNLILGSDYHADYLSSKIISFDNYLFLLLKTSGSLKARVDLLDFYNGHKDKPITTTDIEGLDPGYYLNTFIF